MWRPLSPLLAVVSPLLFATCIYAQRDRDTYNPSNQSFEVSGQVNLAGGSSPAHEVPVRLERFSGGIVDQLSTDARGRFRFGNLQRGYYKVVINTAGYQPAQQEADLTLMFKVYLVFNLVPVDSNANVSSLSLDVIDARIPSSAREEYMRGRDALGRKSHAEAIPHFQQAISIYAEFFDAQLLLGTAYMDLREWQKAENAMGRALEIRPDNARALLSLGEIYWRQKRNAEAERALLDGLKLDENNWHGQFTLGRLYWEAGNALKAGPYVGRTLQLKPDFAEAHLLAGNILLKLAQTQRAKIEYEEYLRLAPKGVYAAEARSLIKKLEKLGN